MATRIGRLYRIITTPGISNRREVMPGSGAQPTLQAGNAPAAHLVLHGVVGGGSDRANRYNYLHKVDMAPNQIFKILHTLAPYLWCMVSSKALRISLRQSI